MTSYIEYKRVTRAHITSLSQQIAKLKASLAQEIVRADLAERDARLATSERDGWKRRAKEAEAELRSRGVTV